MFFRYFVCSFLLFAVVTFVIVPPENVEEFHKFLNPWFPTCAQEKVSTMSQPHAELLQLWTKLVHAPIGPSKRAAQQEMVEALSYRIHCDDSMNLVGNLLLGMTKGPEVVQTLVPAEQTDADDSHCVRELTETFETNCGVLTKYGSRHEHAIANLCRAGITNEQMFQASAQACPTIPFAARSYLQGVARGAY